MMLCGLYVPGDRPERFDKAAASGADLVIIDLEDAVSPDNKDRARANAVEYLAARAAKAPEVHVRINDPRSPRGRDDLSAIAGVPGLGGVRVPKVETTDDLDLVDAVLGTAPVHVLVESARGVSNVDEIAAHPRTAGVGLGEQDLAAELSITGGFALDQLRVRVVVAAAAAGIGPVAMSVFTDLTDEDGLRASCVHGRALGMFGRSAIHPRQVPVIRAAFSPTPAEIAEAREVIEAAGQTGAGAFALPDGRFVDAPILARARKVLALADELAEH